MYLEFGGSVYRIQFIRKYPKTYAILLIKDDDGKFIPTGLKGRSKCEKQDKFDKYEGKRIALNSLLLKITKPLELSREDRINIWNQYYTVFGRKNKEIK